MVTLLHEVARLHEVGKMMIQSNMIQTDTRGSFIVPNTTYKLTRHIITQHIH
jgi:hypothetical protein